MKRLITGSVFLFLLSALVNAQVSVDISPLQKLMDGNKLNLNEIHGSPYLNKEFGIGTILSDAGTLYRNVPLRYDCFDDVFEFIRDNKTFIINPKESVIKVEFGGKVFVYKVFESEKGTGKSYFEVLVDGKVALLARYSINYYDPVPSNGIIDAKPARFDNLTETWYVSIGDSPARKVTNNKTLVQILSDIKEGVEAYISSERLSAKKKDDLKKIIAWYNQ